MGTPGSVSIDLLKSNNMELFLNITQVVTAGLLILSILLQQKGDGLGSAFGGSETIASTRRGAEKGIFNLSIILSAVFIGLSLARMFISI